MLINGRLDGDAAATVILKLRKLLRAVILPCNPKYEEYLYQTKASIVTNDRLN